MANRMGPPVLSVWTTSLFAHEDMLFRRLETVLLRTFLKYSARKNSDSEEARDRAERELELARRFTISKDEPDQSKAVEAYPTQLEFLWRVALSTGAATRRSVVWLYHLAKDGPAARKARQEQAREVRSVLSSDPVADVRASERVSAWSRVVGVVRDQVAKRRVKAEETVSTAGVEAGGRTETQSIKLDKLS